MTRFSDATRTLSILALLCGLAIATPASAQDAVPGEFPVQGFLTTLDGMPINGDVQATFKLYNAASGGDVLFEVTKVVSLTEGAFSTALGAEETLDLSLFRDTTEIYLGVTLEGESEMQPRVKLGTAPFAAVAQYAGGVDWANVTNPPTGVDDGDDDTLADLSCAQGEVAAFDGTTWSCTDVSAADTLGSLSCTSGQVAKFDPANGWSCAEDVKLTEADVDGFVANDGYAKTADLATVATSGSFADLTNVPNDLSDGDDDTLASLSCSSGEVAAWNGSSWVCMESVDSTVVQLRVGSSCSAGSAIRQINQDGTVQCETDDDTTYSPGAGLGASGTSFDVNTGAGLTIQSDAVAIASSGVTSDHIAAGTIVNSDISATAAISPSKISGTAATLTGTQNFDSGTLYIDATSNEVGIGTTTPAADLHVAGTAQFDGNITYACGTLTFSIVCPIGDVDGPGCDEVPPGSFCEGDFACPSVDGSLNNCGSFDWYFKE